MNILEHYIEKIISEEDCTEEYARAIGRQPEYPVIKVVMDIDCYGSTSTVTEHWLQPEWEKIKAQGYYMG